MAEPLSSESLELDDDRISLESCRKLASVDNTYTKEHSYNGDPLQTSCATVGLHMSWTPVSSGFRAAQDERTTRPDDVWVLWNWVSYVIFVGWIAQCIC
jgi:hypothetical protein